MVLGSMDDSTLMRNTLMHGMYPDFMYERRQETYGFPYRYDPRAAEISQSLFSVLSEISRRFRSEFIDHLVWYLWGKPTAVFSWDMVQGMGGSFIYPVIQTPYLTEKYLYLSNWIMQFLHQPVIVLSFLGCLIAWVPMRFLRINPQYPHQAIFMARMLSLLLFYFVTIHMMVAPFPRYSIPLRPVNYAMAGFFVFLLWQSTKEAIVLFFSQKSG